jgi:hypothetical protein
LWQVGEALGRESCHLSLSFGGDVGMKLIILNSKLSPSIVKITLVELLLLAVLIKHGGIHTIATLLSTVSRGFALSIEVLG